MNRRIKFKAIITTFILLFALNLQAQDSTRLLSLREAIDMSIKNSKNLRIAGAKIDEATAVLQEAKDARLPEFSVSGSYLWLNNPNIQMDSKSTSGGNGNGNAGAESPKVNQAIYGMANLSMPIYAGGRIKYGIESAKLLKQASMLDADNDKEDVIYNATSAYINLYKSYESVVVVKENLQSSLARDAQFSNLEKNGLMARNDLLKAQLQTSNIELALLDVEKNNKLAMVNMNLLIGLPENTLLVLDTGFIDTKQDVKTFSDYENLALQKRKDVQALDFRKQASATAIKTARAETYPTIALSGGYIAADIPNLLSVSNAVNLGVGVKYNLSNIYKKNTNLSQAKARQTEVIARQDLLNDQVRAGLSRDYEDYLLSTKKINVFEKAYEQANENYRITKNKFDNSLVTISDLLDANVALLQSKLNISVGKADAILAYNKLLQTTGILSK